MKIYSCEHCGSEVIVSDNLIKCSSCDTEFYDTDGLSYEVV
ncbi:hypothetical protein [Fusobacterium varium]|nr:hypothetical protein [Fusobacterium varium]